MEKVKKIFKDSINAILTVISSELFKICLTFASLVVAIIAVSWGALMTVMTNDLKDVVISKEKEIATLKSSIEYYSQENVRLRLINEDLYECCYEYNNNK